LRIFFSSHFLFFFCPLPPLSLAPSPNQQVDRRQVSSFLTIIIITRGSGYGSRIVPGQVQRIRATKVLCTAFERQLPCCTHSICDLLCLIADRNNNRTKTPRQDVNDRQHYEVYFANMGSQHGQYSKQATCCMV